MPSWIQQAIARGILTSRYPREAASDAEVPATARPVRPTLGSAISADAVNACPVGALAPTGVDDGTCIRCARCLPAGLAFRGPVESSARARPALVVGPSGAARAAEAVPPLADLGRSLHVYLVDVGSCNACNLEVLAIANPFYDASRLGIFFTNSPRHADVLLVVGVPTPEMVEPLRRAYDAVPAPKSVVAVGVCAISGGVFAGSPGLADGVAGIVPVDVFVPGCPPPPVAVIDALLSLVGRQRPAPEG